MIKFYLSLCLFFIFNNAYSQVSTFNNTYDFDYPAAILRGILVTDTCIYASGVIVDSLSPNNSGALFAKFDLNGNILLKKVISDPIKTYYTGSEFIFSSDGCLIATGYTLNDTAINNRKKILLIKYNQQGDTIFTREYISPYHDFNGNSTIIEDKGFLLSNFIYKPVDSKNTLYLIKTDSIGLEIWNTIIEDELDLLSGGKIYIDNNKEYLISGWRTNWYNISQNTSFIGNNAFFLVDSLGSTQEEWYSAPDLKLSSVHDFISTSDSGYICSTSIGTQYNSQVSWHGLIYKINKDFETEWSITYKDTLPSEITGLGKIIELSNGTGYLSSGSVFEYLGGVQDTGWNINGWVVKFTGEGDSLWSRYFHYWDTPYDEHYFSDMEEMPDGGVLLCGQAYSGNVGTQQQLGWLVKLDEFGCLVPGCQLVATENIEGNPQGVALRLYPNPASDILNIYTWSPHTPKNALLRIISSDGQVVRESPVTRSDMTSMIPVRDIPAGVYFVQYVEEGMVVATEEAVIAR